MERERGTHRYFTSRPKAQTRWLNRRRRGRKFSSHTVVMDVVRGGGGNQGGGLKGLKWRKTRQESQSKQRGPIRANLFLFLFPSFPFVFRIILVPAHKRIQTARRPRRLTENALNFTAVFDACCRSSSFFTLSLLKLCPCSWKNSLKKWEIFKKNKKDLVSSSLFWVWKNSVDDCCFIACRTEAVTVKYTHQY